MGLDVKLTLDGTLAVRLAAAIAAGLAAGGEVVKEASVALAPKEQGEPRHGEHMVDTAFARPETGGVTPRVAVGYMAFWAPWQETKDEYHHETGQAHFHETAFLNEGPRALEKVAETISTALA